MTACGAIQFSDRMNCAVCHLAWDTNDADPPTCPMIAQAARIAASIKQGAKLAVKALELRRAGLQVLEPAQATQYATVLRELDKLIETL